MMLDVSSQAKLVNRTRPSADRFCVLITSSNRGRDIFEIVFQNAEMIWRDCDWPRYVGFTSKYPDIYGFKALSSKGPSDWRGEVGDYLDALPSHIEYVLRIDEDALFMSPVDGNKLNAIADLMIRDDLSYVRLVPVTRNFPGRVTEYFRRKLDKQPLRLISFSEPYYSSVELAIWKRSYLRSLLGQPGTIWEFEHTVGNERHYAVWRPIVEQHQIVTRGKWNFKAPRLLARQGLSLANSQREFQTGRSWLRGMREKLSFQLAGFLSFRIRRRLNRISRS
jgi:DNA-binding MarR family transcriptional regulator